MSRYVVNIDKQPTNKRTNHVATQVTPDLNTPKSPLSGHPRPELRSPQTLIKVTPDLSHDRSPQTSCEEFATPDEIREMIDKSWIHASKYRGTLPPLTGTSPKTLTRENYEEPPLREVSSVSIPCSKEMKPAALKAPEGHALPIADLEKDHGSHTDSLPAGVIPPPRHLVLQFQAELLDEGSDLGPEELRAEAFRRATDLTNSIFDGGDDETN
jgi:hypothetical protein